MGFRQGDLVRVIQPIDSSVMGTLPRGSFLIVVDDEYLSSSYTQRFDVGVTFGDLTSIRRRSWRADRFELVSRAPRARIAEDEK